MLSPSLLPFVLVMLPTASQDTMRAKLAEEMTHLDATVNETISKDNERLQRDMQIENGGANKTRDTTTTSRKEAHTFHDKPHELISHDASMRIGRTMIFTHDQMIE